MEHMIRLSFFLRYLDTSASRVACFLCPQRDLNVNYTPVSDDLPCLRDVLMKRENFVFSGHVVFDSLADTNTIFLNSKFSYSTAASLDFEPVKTLASPSSSKLSFDRFFF